MSYIPVERQVILTEEDVTELKSLLERIEQDEFHRRGSRHNESTRDRDLLKRSLERILKQIPHT